jgi:hypothetical protein
LVELRGATQPAEVLAEVPLVLFPDASTAAIEYVHVVAPPAGQPATLTEVGELICVEATPLN